jgi:hypothetical protein
MKTIAMSHELDEAERKAWDALGRYKFWMFGYWAAIWVHLNRVSGSKLPNPWKDLVKFSRQSRDNPKGPSKFFETPVDVIARSMADCETDQLELVNEVDCDD